MIDEQYGKKYSTYHIIAIQRVLATENQKFSLNVKDYDYILIIWQKFVAMKCVGKPITT